MYLRRSCVEERREQFILHIPGTRTHGTIVSTSLSTLANAVDDQPLLVITE